MSQAIQRGVLSKAQAIRMVDLVEKGKLDIQLALNRIRAASPAE